MPPQAPKQYNSPGSFKFAFESRYRDRPERQLVILMQRFAARVCRVIDSAVVKGGLGLEIRLDTPRTTQDADIIIAGSHNLDTRLAEAGKVDLGDFLRFSVTPSSRGTEINAPGMLYPGKRYKIQARFANGPGPWPGDPFRKFTAEISVRSPAGFDILECGLEEFPLVPMVPIRVYSLHWQIAEKVHAYTDHRHTLTTNAHLMRPRDLLDICRCSHAPLGRAKITSESLHIALKQTFERRKQQAHSQGIELQDLPRALPVMPATWENAFQETVKQGSLPWRTSAEAHAAAARFLDPVLSGLATGTWDPVQRIWAEAIAERIAETADPEGSQ